MNSSKKSQYLAVGEFDGGQVLNSVRDYFLRTVQKEVPLVSEQLRDEVLNLFLVTKQNTDPPRLSSATAEQLRKKIIDGTIESKDIAHLRDDLKKGRFDSDPQFLACLKGLFDWSRRWNLHADWFHWKRCFTGESGVVKRVLLTLGANL